MAVSRILLYYTFAPVADPEAVRLWQRALCEGLGLRGRIIVSPHGINGTVGGEVGALKQYAKGTREHPAFANLEFKWSDGGAEDFPRLSVKAREEIVAFGAAGEVRVDAGGVVGGGEHLSPEGVHRLVEERGDDVVFFDGRNAFEARIGRFRDAVVPEVETTRDFVAALDSGRYDHLKSQPVVTYCTGGVRCEVLSALMRNRGFEEVYQLDGGIVRYGEAYGDAGLWEGSLYVFDQRMHLEFTHQALTIGHCERCEAPARSFVNCAEGSCRRLVLLCPDCSAPDAVCPAGCAAAA
ncbi:rhodanese-related sulfurtransferase [Rothia sp. AR01]|uniref:tRNA uridine(34) hydroxylase n=1 Tax=Rothia santali TaxID=2949643 RepID=A0A9X2KMA2_9MICC|nr:rhodanese-related sulfurtransferase [Rothia santali]MCP3426986.1 rhodanese-related sulfurtransferase [Rothia santali]